MGSGNIGATNVYRAAGTRAGVIVLLLDMLKGFLAVWLTSLITPNHPLAAPLAAAAVMIGHGYPIWLGFKGGKAVACFVGAFLLLTPLALSVSLIIFIAIVGIFKYISLGSIVGAAVFPLAVWGLEHSPQPVLMASIFASLLIIYRHKANISRLIKGQENVFSFRKGSTEEDTV